jgi:short-subunit dehydrogenase
LVEEQIAAIRNISLLINNVGFAGYAPFTGLYPEAGTAAGKHGTSCCGSG